MNILFYVLGLIIASHLGEGLDPVSFTQTSQDWFDLRFLDKNVAILLTRDGLVFRTENLGSTWEQLNDKMFLSWDSDNSPAYLYPSTTDPNKIYIRGRGQVCWISNDKGETWRTVYPGRILVNLDWHPVNSEWAIASDGTSLYGTRDFGMTWQKVADNNQNYAWGDAGLGSVPESRIYAVLPNAEYLDFQYTDDWGVTFITIQSKAFDFVWGDRQVYVAVELPTQGKVALKVSTDIGVPFKNFLEGTFPFGQDLDNWGYSIVDDATGAVYLGIVHSLDLSTNWGNMYVSDSTGSQYSVTLQNVHQIGGIFDFTRVRGIDGFYLGNIVSDNTDPDSPVISLFTFDNGASWNRLVPPHFDSLNQSISCVGACSLHLHGWSSSFPSQDHQAFGPLYSNANAVGLILANGNVGTDLEYDESKVNTYMSRDGGHTWVELRKGPSHARFGDHGGIVVMSDSSVYSNTIYYSLTEGTTPTQQISFSGSAVKPFRILSEKSATELKFVMLGSTINGTYDSVVGIDFKDAFSRECDPDDYYRWSPSNGQEDCVLGRQIVYLRRNTTKLCYNSESVEHVFSQTNCVCTEDDWECDVGYEAVDGGYCKVSGTPIPEPPANCPTGYNYTKTKGYRKEAGNTCFGGVDHSPDGPYPCPEVSTKKKHQWVAAIVFVLVVVVIIIVAFILMKSERVREHVPFLKFLHEKTAYLKLSSQPETVEDREKLYIPNESEEEQLEVRDKTEEEEEELEKKEEKKVEKKEEKKAEPQSLLSMEDDFNPRA